MYVLPQVHHNVTRPVSIAFFVFYALQFVFYVLLIRSCGNLRGYYVRRRTQVDAGAKKVVTGTLFVSRSVGINFSAVQIFTITKQLKNKVESNPFTSALSLDRLK